MKKNYIYPTIEILPFCAVSALCTSGEQQEGLIVDPNGRNPWTGGRSPRRTAPF